MAYSQVAIYGMNEKVRAAYKKQLQQHEAPDSAIICKLNLPLPREAPFRAPWYINSRNRQLASMHCPFFMMSSAASCWVPFQVFSLDIPPAWVHVTWQSMRTSGLLQSVTLDVACLQVGLVSYPSEEGSFNKPFSNDTAQMIDVEVRKMVQSAYERTISLLTEKKALVTKLAETLLHKEVRSHGWASGTSQAAGLRKDVSCLCWLASLLVKQWTPSSGGVRHSTTVTTPPRVLPPFDAPGCSSSC